MTNYFYPFSAIVGQDTAKNALIYNLINPRIGGVLLSGQKGTAKSTLVRSIQELTDEQQIIELPLNITEDMLIGTIDIQNAIQYGAKTLLPGILAKANNNILYVDEVNLLADSIINSLLDVSSSGINKVEREGISLAHPAKFSLIGTMNPEEGGLRSEFLDRFGIYIDIKGTMDQEQRKEIIKRRLAFDANPLAFRAKYTEQTASIKKQIKKAKTNLNKIIITEEALDIIADLCYQSLCAGHRGEITIVEIAKAIAAYYDEPAITTQHIKEAAVLALPHRIREYKKDFLTLNNSSAEELADAAKDDVVRIEEQSLREDKNEDSDKKKGQPTPSVQYQNKQTRVWETEDKLVMADEVFVIKDLGILHPQKSGSNQAGKRQNALSNSKRGRYRGSRIPQGDYSDIAFDATLKTSAPHQKSRKNLTGITIHKEDIRVKIREQEVSTYILFVVDASGSMGANDHMKVTKEAILSLLYDAYQKRDKVGLIAFRDNRADIILDFTNSIDLAQKKIQFLPTGGKTPLAAGLLKAFQVIKRQKSQEPAINPLLVLVSDGIPSQGLHENSNLPEEVLAIAQKIGAEKIDTLVIDTERSYVSLNLCKKITKLTNGRYIKISGLKAAEIRNAVMATR